MKTALIVFIISIFLTSCKSQKTSCDAYSQKEIKKDHQI